MVDRRLVDEWLGKADEDFGFASINLDEDRPFFPQICFHFHQAAEKYLKAYIVANVLAFRKAHDLVLLLQRRRDSCPIRRRTLEPEFGRVSCCPISGEAGWVPRGSAAAGWHHDDGA